MLGDEAISRAQVFRWYKACKNGRRRAAKWKGKVDVQTDNNAQRVRTLVRQDRRLTVQMLYNELNINRDKVRKILVEDSCMKKHSAEMVPKCLSEKQKHV